MTERLEKLRQNDHRIQDTVFGFVRECQKLITNDDSNSYYNIPELINHIIIKYYYNKELSYNHLLLASEIFYLKELECIENCITIPLKNNVLKLSDSTNISIDDINDVFKHWNNLIKFHYRFLNEIKEKKHILPTVYKYINFTKIYIEYATEYESMLNIFSKWNSKPFKQFIIKQLNNENVIKIIENSICSLPWYLYRPFDRIKEYRRFVKDLQLLSNQNDNHYQLIIKTKSILSNVYKQIKKNEQIFQQKTRIIEIQLSLNNTPFKIYDNERILSSAKNYNVKYGNHKCGKMKIYIFNNLLLFATLSDKYGISNYLTSFSFYSFGLIFNITPKHENISYLDIYLESNKNCKLKILFKEEIRRDKLLKKLQTKYKQCQEKLWAETTLNCTTKALQETNINFFHR